VKPSSPLIIHCDQVLFEAFIAVVTVTKFHLVCLFGIPHSKGGKKEKEGGLPLPLKSKEESSKSTFPLPQTLYCKSEATSQQIFKSLIPLVKDSTAQPHPISQTFISTTSSSKTPYLSASSVHFPFGKVCFRFRFRYPTKLSYHNPILYSSPQILEPISNTSPTWYSSPTCTVLCGSFYISLSISFFIILVCQLLI